VRFINNITTFLLVGVLLAFGTNQIPVGASTPHITDESRTFAYRSLELSDPPTPNRAGSPSSAAQALDNANEAPPHCAHCASTEGLAEVAPNCCKGCKAGASDKRDSDKRDKCGGCSKCPAQQGGGCCGNGYTSLFLNSYSDSISFPGESLAYSPEDWAATQRAHRPLLQPPRCA
jgi:hypothetical protein